MFFLDQFIVLGGSRLVIFMIEFILRLNYFYGYVDSSLNDVY